MQGQDSTTSAAVAEGAEVTAVADDSKPHKQQSAAEKVRLKHGQVPKTPGANVSISRFYAPVQTTDEQVLFWKLLNRFTKSGSTQWDAMSGLWCFTAAQRHQQGDFTLCYKTPQHLKEFHKQQVKLLAQGLGMAAPAADLAAVAKAAALQAQAAAATAAAAAAACAAPHGADRSADAYDKCDAPPALVTSLQGSAGAGMAQPLSAGAGTATAHDRGRSGQHAFSFVGLGSSLLQAAGSMLSNAVNKHPTAEGAAAAAPGSMAASGAAAAAAATSTGAAVPGAVNGTAATAAGGAPGSSVVGVTAAGTAVAAGAVAAVGGKRTGTWLDAAAAKQPRSKSSSSAAAARTAGRAAAGRVQGRLATPAAAAGSGPKRSAAATTAAEAGSGAVAVGSVWFPAGYPTTLETGRAISTCNDCKRPKRVPHPGQLGQLMKAPTAELHTDTCPSRPKVKVIKSGAKKGQRPASAALHSDS